MRKPTSSFLAFLLAGACCLRAVFAEAPPALTVDQIAQKVEDAQAGAQDVQMDLKMRMQDVLSGQTQEIQGVVKLKNPDLVFAHYLKPNEQFLYINGDLAQMYQPSQNTVYRQRSAAGAGAGPIYLGVGQELKRYIAICKVSIVQDSGDQVVLLFIPKASDASFDKMKVTIGKKDWWPTRMEVETPSLITRSEFSNFRFNQGVDSKVFQFTSPKGADVVEGAIF
jgi:outer membrane lipoprotein-sorting protein